MKIEIEFDERLPVVCQGRGCFNIANKIVIYKTKCPTYPGEHVVVEFLCDDHFPELVPKLFKDVEAINIWPPFSVPNE